MTSPPNQDKNGNTFWRWANDMLSYYLHDQTGPNIEQQVKENMDRIQAQKEQQELLSTLSQNQEISAKINISSPKTYKKL